MPGTRPRRSQITTSAIVGQRTEDILKAVHFYRYMTALDVAHLLYSPKSLTYVRACLRDLAGGSDFQRGHYLFRFRLPSSSTGNAERVYTLGSKGRDFLAHIGLAAEWYYRPHKVEHLGYSQLVHNLLLTRFLVGALVWSRSTQDVVLVEKRISYELATLPVDVVLTDGGRSEKIKVIPDAWLRFESREDQDNAKSIPVLFELDRGTQYQQKFKKHIRSRLEFIRGGLYEKLFGTKAVLIAYATTGATRELGETRRRVMCAWTADVLAELRRQNWASVFRFCSLVPEELYQAPVMSGRVWYRPDLPHAVRLLAP